MDRMTAQELSELLQIKKFPCISIYLPVERVGLDTRQGAIRLRKQIKAVAEALHERGVRTPLIEQMLRPAEMLYDDALFWEHQDKGLALFIHADGMKKHQLAVPCEESTTLSDRFMILPLLAEAPHDRTYYLLALSLDDTRLYQATRYQLIPEDLPEPKSLRTVVATYSLEKQLQHHSSAGVGSGGGAVFHAPESARDAEKQRIDEYFRQLEANMRRKLNDSDAPLVVACVDYLFPMFKAVCKDCRLIDEHLSGSPETMKKDDLLGGSWQIARTVFERDKDAAIKACERLAGSDRIRSDIGRIMPLAWQGRIGTLLVRGGRQLWGRWDPDTGKLIEHYDGPQQFGEPDLISQAARMTLEHGGQVFILHDSEMPDLDHADCISLLRF